jgi:tRNA A37 threonylcarbamoyladenosine synthetase subunit TsaC/SUA5/YrdC
LGVGVGVMVVLAAAAVALVALPAAGQLCLGSKTTTLGMRCSGTAVFTTIAQHSGAPLAAPAASLVLPAPAAAMLVQVGSM